MALFKERVPRGGNTGSEEDSSFDEDGIGTLRRDVDAPEMAEREEEATGTLLREEGLVWAVASIESNIDSAGTESALHSGMELRGWAGEGRGNDFLFVKTVEGGGGAEVARMAERSVLHGLREMNGADDELSTSGAAEELLAILP